MKNLKKILYNIPFLFLFHIAQGQVGLRTTMPEGIFHIDSGGNNNNSATTSTTITDDVIVDASGSLGVGTKPNSVKLNIQSGGTSTAVVEGFKLNDGSENNKYVLTSDSDGVGSWKAVSMPESVNGVLSSSVIDYAIVSSTSFLNTGSYITLNPGTWKVEVTLTFLPWGISMDENAWMWIKSSFSESALSTSISSDVGVLANQNSAGKLVSTVITGPTYYDNSTSTMENSKKFVATGFIYITNSSSSSKSYYLIIGDSTARNGNNSYSPTGGYLYRVGSNEFPDNKITALPMSPVR